MCGQGRKETDLEYILKTNCDHPNEDPIRTLRESDPPIVVREIWLECSCSFAQHHQEI
jgi:hypothetical protein